MERRRRTNGGMSRRRFLAASAAAGTGVVFGPGILRAANAGDDINVALVGAGNQGRVLLKDSLKVPGIRFKAVCDIWSYSRRYAKGLLRKYKQTVNVYADFHEMLGAEKDLDAVLVATPDWMHAEYAVACMEAGKHVYCEKEMSNVLKAAGRMVLAARKSGKLLQIGHQRRSNPVYIHALESLDKEKICGRITNCYGQWNRMAQGKLEWPGKYEIPADVLKKYGYDTMDRFRNWRWYKKFSAGPIADLGSHQIDVFSWFLHSDPVSVMATAGHDYFKDREWYEDIMAVYDYKTAAGSVRAFYQVLNTSSYGDYFERFHGDGGALVISENAKACCYVPEFGKSPPEWMGAVEPVMRNGKPAIPLVDALPKKGAAAAAAMADWEKKNAHQLHLENFFSAIRAGDARKLTCPPELAYPTAVAVLNVIPAVEMGKRIVLGEADYTVG